MSHKNPPKPSEVSPPKKTPITTQFEKTCRADLGVLTSPSDVPNVDSTLQRASRNPKRLQCPNEG